ncbi:hypothetical protein A9Q93_03480 [Nonlabens dokdonensis]|uniref:Glycosyltransferase n=1 Tax=Nonlabens dokdonensis TaxID=328515 RepID=A0A1Z8B7X7_9FLAO|nr:hypothetical protein [Nonlabens dokdonensis]OUS18691.1 hypothetical protein A9Q93_03480 [Nonlabens dokdonensis]
MIVHYTLFQGKEFGNGAYRRSFQIASLLSTLDEEVITLSKYPVQKNDVSLLERVKLAFRFSKFLGYQKLDFNTLRYKVLDIILWKKYLTSLKTKDEDLKVVIDLSYYSDEALVFACYELGIEMIGILHNMESLVHQQKSHLSGKVAPDWFFEEINLLKFFSSIYTISREEQWLLSLYGIKAHYLPYVPSENVISNCLAIKKLRQHSEKKYYLSIGTASNPPTVEGFKELIYIFEGLNLDEKLVIGGYDTEKMASFLSNKTKKVYLKGALSEKELEQVLVECKAIIIHQKPTTGALTKIPELLLSGIPVICNTSSARNYYYLNGVHVYKTGNELKKILKHPKLLAPFDFNLENKNKKFLDEFN